MYNAYNTSNLEEGHSNKHIWTLEEVYSANESDKNKVVHWKKVTMLQIVVPRKKFTMPQIVEPRNKGTATLKENNGANKSAKK